MSEVSLILSDASDNDPSVAERLLPLVYSELRRLAAAKIHNEQAGVSLQATSLVHEAYLRLVQPEPGVKWNGRGHFFSAAAEAMRRIMIERARRKQAQKRGGDLKREHLPEDAIEAPDAKVDLLDLDAALDKLQTQAPRKAELVKLRYFVGLTLREAADVLGISSATADRDWAYAKAWLFDQVSEHGQ